MKRNPEELGKLFEIISNKSSMLLKNIFPLTTSLQSIYEANQLHMLDTINRDDLRSAVLNLEHPIKFVKKRDDARQVLNLEVGKYKTLKEDMTTEVNKTLEEKFDKIKSSIELIPLKVQLLIERYAYIISIFGKNKFIENIFKAFEIYNTSGSVKRFKKTLWRKSMYLTATFGYNLNDLLMHLYTAIKAFDEFTLNECIDRFDAMVEELDIYKFKYINKNFF